MSILVNTQSVTRMIDLTFDVQFSTAFLVILTFDGSEWRPHRGGGSRLMAMVSDTLLERLFFFRLVSPNPFHGHLKEGGVALHNKASFQLFVISTSTRPNSRD